MSKTKKQSQEQQTFEEWMISRATPTELGNVLSCLASGDFSVDAIMREAYEAGIAANEAVCGIPARKIRQGELFRKVRGQQVYMMISGEHLGIIDFRGQDRRLAVNAKGNAIKIDRCARVVRCEEKEWFAAKRLPQSE